MPPESIFASAEGFRSGAGAGGLKIDSTKFQIFRLTLGAGRAFVVQKIPEVPINAQTDT